MSYCLNDALYTGRKFAWQLAAVRARFVRIRWILAFVLKKRASESKESRFRVSERSFAFRTRNFHLRRRDICWSSIAPDLDSLRNFFTRETTDFWLYFLDYSRETRILKCCLIIIIIRRLKNGQVYKTDTCLWLLWRLWLFHCSVQWIPTIIVLKSSATLSSTAPSIPSTRGRELPLESIDHKIPY